MNLELSAETYLYIGYAGVVFYLGAYAGLQFGFIKGTGYTYAFLNLIGAVLVLISLVNSFNMASFLTQVSFIFLSVAGMIRFFILSNIIRFNHEEEQFLNFKFPTLNKLASRKFLDNGTWVDADIGTEICTQDEELGKLIYVSDGEAEVIVNGKVVGSCRRGNYIGEMTVFRGGAASATLKIKEPSRLFIIEAERLKKICLTDPVLNASVETSINRDVRDKLIQSNKRMANSVSQ